MSAKDIDIDLAELHPDQQAIADEEGRFNVLACGRRYGKTVYGMDRAIDGPKGLLDGLPVGWFAPEYKLLLESWRELCDTLKPITKRRNDQEKRLILINGAVLEGWAFDRNPDAGRSRKYGRIVVDEAAHCEHLERWWTKAGRPTLADYQGYADFVSSPNGPTYFHKLFKRGQRSSGDWKSWTRTSYDNPYILATEIDSARDDIGDWAFEQEYLAVFHADAVNSLLQDFWIDRMRAVADECKRLRSNGKGGKRILSADLGEGTGRDLFVAMVRDDLGVIACRAGNRIGIPEAANVIGEMATFHNVRQENIVYDAGGPGKDLPRYLEHHQITEAIGYHGSGTGGTKYFNRRSKMAWKLRQRLDPERPMPFKPIEVDPNRKPSAFDLPMSRRAVELQPPFGWEGGAEHWPRLAEEMKALRYGMKGKKVALETKEEMMKILGRSPNYLDALMMSFFVGDE